MLEYTHTTNAENVDPRRLIEQRRKVWPATGLLSAKGTTASQRIDADGHTLATTANAHTTTGGRAGGHGLPR